MIGRRLTLVGVVGALVAGCSGSGGGATTTVVAAQWVEPADYSFVLMSDCGERSGLGTYDVTVANHEVVAAEALDEQADIELGAGGVERVPTIADLVAELEEAQAMNADTAAMAVDPGDGHPVRIDIDYDAATTDDEACYSIDDYRATPG